MDSFAHRLRTRLLPFERKPWRKAVLLGCFYAAIGMAAIVLLVVFSVQLPAKLVNGDLPAFSAIAIAPLVETIMLVVVVGFWRMIGRLLLRPGLRLRWPKLAPTTLFILVAIPFGLLHVFPDQEIASNLRDFWPYVVIRTSSSGTMFGGMAFQWLGYRAERGINRAYWAVVLSHATCNTIAVGIDRLARIWLA